MDTCSHIPVRNRKLEENKYYENSSRYLLGIHNVGCRSGVDSASLPIRDATLGENLNLDARKYYNNNDECDGRTKNRIFST